MVMTTLLISTFTKGHAMPKHTPPQTVARIKKLHSDKLSNNQIAIRVGIARSTVGRILRGDAPVRKPQNTHKPNKLVSHVTNCAPYPCDGCKGKMVKTRPCVACRTRAWMAAR